MMKDDQDQIPNGDQYDKEELFKYLVVVAMSNDTPEVVSLSSSHTSKTLQSAT
jgi:hypothetical protein